jgi:hypothetical protein
VTERVKGLQDVGLLALRLNSVNIGKVYGRKTFQYGTV